MFELNKNRIQLLVVSYSLSGGGAERFTSTLLSHLDRKRFKPSLCLIRNEISYPVPADIPLTLLGKTEPRHLLRAFTRLINVITKTQPHVVLSVNAFAAQITGAALLKCGSKPHWIARIGGNPAYDEKQVWRRIIGDLWNNVSYRKVNQFVANSKGLTHGFTNYYPFTNGKVGTIFNPTDFAFIDRLAQEKPALHLDPTIPMIITVGNLLRPKRLDILLRSFALLRNRMKAILYICGEGPLRKQLEMEVNYLKLNKSVYLLGFQENPYCLMVRSKIFVMTSDHEGLPNALIEAQGLGIPSISTRCPYGPDEIIDEGKTGLLTEVGDIRAIADAMENLLRDPERMIGMGKAARERAHQLFDKSKIIHEWESLFEKTIKNH